MIRRFMIAFTSIRPTDEDRATGSTLPQTSDRQAAGLDELAQEAFELPVDGLAGIAVGLKRELQHAEPD